MGCVGTWFGFQDHVGEAVRIKWEHDLVAMVGFQTEADVPAAWKWRHQTKLRIWGFISWWPTTDAKVRHGFLSKNSSFEWLAEQRRFGIRSCLRQPSTSVAEISNTPIINPIESKTLHILPNNTNQYPSDKNPSPSKRSFFLKTSGLSKKSCDSTIEFPGVGSLVEIQFWKCPVRPSSLIGTPPLAVHLGETLILVS